MLDWLPDCSKVQAKDCGVIAFFGMLYPTLLCASLLYCSSCRKRHLSTFFAGGIGDTYQLLMTLDENGMLESWSVKLLSCRDGLVKFRDGSELSRR